MSLVLNASARPWNSGVSPKNVSDTPCLQNPPGPSQGHFALLPNSKPSTGDASPMIEALPVGQEGGNCFFQFFHGKKLLRKIEKLLRRTENTCAL